MWCEGGDMRTFGNNIKNMRQIILDKKLRATFRRGSKVQWNRAILLDESQKLNPWPLRWGSEDASGFRFQGFNFGSKESKLVPRNLNPPGTPSKVGPKEEHIKRGTWEHHLGALFMGNKFGNTWEAWGTTHTTRGSIGNHWEHIGNILGT
jgi:hypothetical protein